MIIYSIFILISKYLHLKLKDKNIIVSNIQLGSQNDDIVNIIKQDYALFMLVWPDVVVQRRTLEVLFYFS